MTMHFLRQDSVIQDINQGQHLLRELIDVCRDIAADIKPRGEVTPEFICELLPSLIECIKTVQQHQE